MESNKEFDRCCNPFGLAIHLKKTGLRRVTDKMKQTLGLSDFYLLCSSCRKKASAIINQKTSDIDDDNDTLCDNDTISDDNDNNKSDSDTDAADLLGMWYYLQKILVKCIKFLTFF